MSDLPQPLLAHLRREAKDERDRARASREEKERNLQHRFSKCAKVGRLGIFEVVEYGIKGTYLTTPADAAGRRK